MTDISKITYETAGVSITAQNEVNFEIKRKLKDLGIKADGLFGGAIDISNLKNQKHVPIGIVCSSIIEHKNLLDAGEYTVKNAIKKISAWLKPLAILDYYASEGMSKNEVPLFVEGVARAGLEQNILTIGGESAQMPGTYKKGKRDAYVDIIYKGDQGTTIDIVDLIKNMEKPLICASTDGSGTKPRTVKDPRDIIYHGSNDLGAIGVKPVAFKLYVAGNIPEEELEKIVKKSKIICEEVGIKALDATIEYKPEQYAKDEVDIAGTVLGVIDQKNMITGRDVQKGDLIIGIATDNLMTNGHSLARKFIETIKDPLNAEGLYGIENSTIKKELSKPHVPYIDILFGNNKTEGILSKFYGQIKATAHITGGGQKDNISRMIPDGLCAYIQKEVLPLPPIVKYFQKNGADMNAMCESFNMGVGFSVTVPQKIATPVMGYVNYNFRQSIKGVDRVAAQIGIIKTGDTKFKYIEN